MADRIKGIQEALDYIESHLTEELEISRIARAACLSDFHFQRIFGALCGIVDIFIGGFGYAVTKWISGIPFDLMHCAGNFVMALLLFMPLRRLLNKLYHK